MPLWWHPLPAPTASEALWDRWARDPHGPLILPASDQLSSPFREAPSSLLHLRLPTLLELPLLRQLYGEVKAAHLAGTLALERGGVGAHASTSVHRWDRVRFNSGMEAALLRAAPSLAAFLQWCLGELADSLAPAVRGDPLFPPRKAMLARFPAPSSGYSAHFDNRGGDRDNGRCLTLLVYLNPPEAACNGGELAVWTPGSEDGAPPAMVIPAQGGTGILFDARAIAHEVRPVRSGPDRWAIAFWFNDAPTEPIVSRRMPRLTPTDVLLPIQAPPLPQDVVPFHQLDDDSVTGRVEVRTVPTAEPRVGVVSTVYRSGSDLDAWCAHHFELGMEHIVLIFDHLDDPLEAADAKRLASIHSPSRLTVWSGEQLMQEDWPRVPHVEVVVELKRHALGGSSSVAVSARQSLNASAALCAAKVGTLGTSLDWLLHLDADEQLYLEGAGRGGKSLHDRYAVANAAGLCAIRCLNHELLLPHKAGSSPGFKLNPRLAAAPTRRCRLAYACSAPGHGPVGPTSLFHWLLQWKVGGVG